MILGKLFLLMVILLWLPCVSQSATMSPLASWNKGESHEWAYDRKTHIGKLDKGLGEANKLGWTVVGMKHDWKDVYPQ